MNHINTKISDYVLDLLPQQERRDVAQHVAHCAECEAVLASEQAVGHLLRQTVHEVTQPSNGTLRQLMPAIPGKQSHQWVFNRPWQRQLASVGMLLILLLGGMGWYESNRSSSMGPVPTFIAITATYTNEPTTTATTTQATAEPVITAVSANPEPAYSATPPPNPTPIAALPAVTN